MFCVFIMLVGDVDVEVFKMIDIILWFEFCLYQFFGFLFIVIRLRLMMMYGDVIVEFSLMKSILMN